MTPENEVLNPTADREIVITRLLDAPRELIWKVWTTPGHVVNWWGPQGFTNTIHEMAVKPGGVWRYDMHGPDGTDYKNRVIYIAVIEPELLEYTHDADDDPDFKPFHATVLFEEAGDQSQVTMRLLLESAEERARMVEFGAVEGGQSTLNCLAEYLKTLS